ncbi:hypothetical protein PCASD_26400 [Puccinia coronata f. sp. avenae]|uniref:Uncharacterized protein n=1 Tax=Puccinia coronata f. sp. avenae TaxID=200324 RepID=A0A2N5TKK6_9BASI|nr:hypothetical protein PCASD_26400 [Puccinia coronata f. sp. avenae]
MVDFPAIHNLRGHELEDPTISKEKKGLEASNKPAGLAADFFFRPTEGRAEAVHNHLPPIHELRDLDKATCNQRSA